MTVEATTKAISVPRRTLSLLAISLVVLIAVGGLFKPSESTWIIVFGVFSLFFGSLIITTTGWMYVSLLLGFVLRVALLWVDLYTDIALFASGGDTENFYQTALSIYHDPSLFGADLYGGAFPKICAVLFWVVGPSRLFVQYLNILMSLVGMLFIGLSMHRLSIPEKTSRNVMLVCALMPVPAIISSIFLREALIFCLVAISFYAFTRWLAGGTIRTILVAFSAIAIAGIFHLGVLGLAGGYAIALLFYSREETRFVFSISSLLRGLPIILTVAFVMLRYPELFLEKLDRVSTTEDAIAIATSTTAGSAYLSDFNLDNPILVFLFGWVKGLYLLTSPLPMDWRGLGDIVSFTLDGAFYLLGILVVVWAYSGSEKSVRRRMLAVLLVGVLSAVLVLGLGTKAAGTAMRHRQKLLPAIAVVVAFALSVRQERKRTLKGFPSLSNRTTRGEAESGEAVGRREQ